MKQQPSIKIVIACPKAFVEYRRRARASKVEVLGIFVGHATKGTVVITDIVYPRCAATVDWVRCLERYPANAVGTIHSHKNRQPLLSHQDMLAQAHIGDRVFAIYSMWQVKGRNMGRICFYAGSPGVRVFEELAA